MLLDADGLWALGGAALLDGARRPAVLTPHEGELGRLLGRPAGEVAAHRLASAREAAAAPAPPSCSRARRASSPTRPGRPT